MQGRNERIAHFLDFGEAEGKSVIIMKKWYDILSAWSVLIRIIQNLSWICIQEGASTSREW